MFESFCVLIYLEMKINCFLQFFKIFFFNPEVPKILSFMVPLMIPELFDSVFYINSGKVFLHMNNKCLKNSYFKIKWPLKKLHHAVWEPLASSILSFPFFYLFISWLDYPPGCVRHSIKQCSAFSINFLCILVPYSASRCMISWGTLFPVLSKIFLCVMGCNKKFICT